MKPTIYIDNVLVHNGERDATFHGYVDGKKVELEVKGLKYGIPENTIAGKGWYIRHEDCVELIASDFVIDRLRSAHPEYNIVDER